MSRKNRRDRNAQNQQSRRYNMNHSLRISNKDIKIEFNDEGLNDNSSWQNANLVVQVQNDGYRPENRQGRGRDSGNKQSAPKKYSCLMPRKSQSSSYVDTYSDNYQSDGSSDFPFEAKRDLTFSDSSQNDEYDGDHGHRKRKSSSRRQESDNHSGNEHKGPKRKSRGMMPRKSNFSGDVDSYNNYRHHEDSSKSPIRRKCESPPEENRDDRRHPKRRCQSPEFSGNFTPIRPTNDVFRNSKSPLRFDNSKTYQNYSKHNRANSGASTSSGRFTHETYSEGDEREQVWTYNPPSPQYEDDLEQDKPTTPEYSYPYRYPSPTYDYDDSDGEVPKHHEHPNSLQNFPLVPKKEISSNFPSFSQPYSRRPEPPSGYLSSSEFFKGIQKPAKFDLNHEYYELGCDLIEDRTEKDVERHPISKHAVSYISSRFPEIAESSQCQVYMHTPYVHQPYQSVIIKSKHQEDIKKARKIIDDLQWKRIMENVENRIIGLPSVVENSVTFYQFVPDNAKGAVIGKKQENLKGIMNSTGCVINLITNRCDSNTPIEIMGTLDDVCSARSQIRDIISKSKSPSDCDDAHFLIPRFYMGQVMGTAGATIKKIQKESGAKCHVDPDNGDRQRLMRVNGTEEQIQKVYDAIQEILDDGAPFSDDEGIFEIELKGNQIGRLLANRGTPIKEICEESNTKFIFTENEEKSVLTVSGGLMEAEYARHLVAVKIGNLPKDATFIPYGYGNLSKIKQISERAKKRLAAAEKSKRTSTVPQLPPATTDDVKPTEIVPEVPATPVAPAAPVIPEVPEIPEVVVKQEVIIKEEVIDQGYDQNYASLQEF